jgi:hypothetical protein
MNFKEWLSLTEDWQRTTAKLGLYSDIDSLVGQHPPLYGTPKAADYITYIDIQYGAKGPPMKSPGIFYQKPGKAVNGVWKIPD